jgi:hypothetical protein
VGTSKREDFGSLSLRERAGVRGADLMFKKVIIVHCDIDKPPFVILRLALRKSTKANINN